MGVSPIDSSNAGSTLSHKQRAAAGSSESRGRVISYLSNGHSSTEVFVYGPQAPMVMLLLFAHISFSRFFSSNKGMSLRDIEVLYETSWSSIAPVSRRCRCWSHCVGITPNGRQISRCPIIVALLYHLWSNVQAAIKQEGKPKPRQRKEAIQGSYLLRPCTASPTCHLSSRIPVGLTPRACLEPVFLTPKPESSGDKLCHPGNHP